MLLIRCNGIDFSINRDFGKKTSQARHNLEYLVEYQVHKSVSGDQK